MGAPSLKPEIASKNCVNFERSLCDLETLSSLDSAVQALRSRLKRFDVRYKARYVSRGWYEVGAYEDDTLLDSITVRGRAPHVKPLTVSYSVGKLNKFKRELVASVIRSVYADIKGPLTVFEGVKGRFAEAEHGGFGYSVLLTGKYLLPAKRKGAYVISCYRIRTKTPTRLKACQKRRIRDAITLTHPWAKDLTVHDLINAPFAIATMTLDGGMRYTFKVLLTRSYLIPAKRDGEFVITVEGRKRR